MKKQTHRIQTEQDRERIAAVIAKLDLSKRWDVVIGMYRKKRSLPQNALMWKNIGEIADQTGNDPDDVHEWMKRKFLTPRIFTINGEEIEVWTTKHLTTVEMMQYQDRYRAWAGEFLGLYLTHPDDQGR